MVRVMALVALVGCSKVEVEKGGDAAATTRTDAGSEAGVLASGTLDAAVPAIASPTGSPAGSEDWHGGYKSVGATLSLPAHVAWHGVETDAGLGEGTMTLKVNEDTRRVTGLIDGVLGPATVRGLLADGRLTATIARVDPADRGFTGTLVGSVTGHEARGTMNLSLAEAGALRTATFELTPAKQPEAR